jgi:hypothetical protein
MDFYKKYLKYKNKYLVEKNKVLLINTNKLKTQIGGEDGLDNLDFFFNYNIKEKEIIEKYDFNRYDLFITPINRVGNPSANGFVNKIFIKNLKDNKKFVTIMKNSVSRDADNNYYEYVTGRCINKLKKYFPNFIYTFRFLNLNSELKEGLKNSNFTNVKKFEDSESKENEDNLLSYKNIGNGCKNNDKASIMIEYIQNSLSIDELLKDNEFNANKNVEVFNILFQLYALLSSLKDIYTHYDLHYNNVMFVKVPDNKVVSITYTINDKHYLIFTHFIPVIIDYGRSHISCLKLNESKETNLINSKLFSEIACENPECNSKAKPYCNMYNSGLIVDRDSNESYSKHENFYSIDVRHTNQTIDLRFINLFMTKLDNNLPIKLRYEENFDKFWLTNNKSKHLDNPDTLLPGIKERPSNLSILRKISTTSDCILWLINLHSGIYINSHIMNKVKYGSIKINTNIDKKINWSFEPLN